MNKIIFKDNETEQSFIVSKEEYNKMYNLIMMDEKRKLLQENILGRYDNEEYWDIDLINEYESGELQ
jgi:hypothetical protein